MNYSILSSLQSAASIEARFNGPVPSFPAAGTPLGTSAPDTSRLCVL